MLVVPIGQGVRLELPDARVLHVSMKGRNVVLRFNADGPKIRRRAVGGRTGRKPSPATQKLRDTMMADAKAGRVRSREEYRQILAEEGGPKQGASSTVILGREAKRAFGHGLARGKGSAKKGRPRKTSTGSSGKRGRRPSPATAVLREKLQADAAHKKLGTALHYTGWLVGHSKLSPEKARPIVYRELKSFRQ